MSRTLKPGITVLAKAISNLTDRLLQFEWGCGVDLDSSVSVAERCQPERTGVGYITKTSSNSRGGFEYLHHSPASCRGNEKETLFLGTWPSRLGSLESETVKCGYEFRETRTWERLRWRVAGAIINDRPILSSDRMLHKDYDSKCSVENILLVVSLKGLVTKTNRLAVNASHKVTPTLWLTVRRVSRKDASISK
jgi:hypothetical protein